MSTITLNPLPSGVSNKTLAELVRDARNREAVLQAVIERFQQRYQSSHLIIRAYPTFLITSMTLTGAFKSLN